MVQYASIHMYIFGLVVPQESLNRARQELDDARAQAAPLERERAAAAEEARQLQERRVHAEQAHEELRKQVRIDCGRVFRVFTSRFVFE